MLLKKLFESLFLLYILIIIIVNNIEQFSIHDKLSAFDRPQFWTTKNIILLQNELLE